MGAPDAVGSAGFPQFNVQVPVPFAGKADPPPLPAAAIGSEKGYAEGKEFEKGGKPDNAKAPLSDHFWKLRCRKSVRRCGEKHISKSKCTKHYLYAPLLEVQMTFRVACARHGAPSYK